MSVKNVKSAMFQFETCCNNFVSCLNNVESSLSNLNVMNVQSVKSSVHSCKKAAFNLNQKANKIYKQTSVELDIFFRIYNRDLFVFMMELSAFNTLLDNINVSLEKIDSLENDDLPFTMFLFYVSHYASEIYYKSLELNKFRTNTINIKRETNLHNKKLIVR